MFPETRLSTVITAALALAAGAMTAHAGQIAFESVPFPTTDTEKRTILSSAQVQVNGQWMPSGFNTLLRSGDTLPLLVGAEPSATQIRYGTLIQKNGAPLMDSATGAVAISNSNDFNSLIRAGDKLYLVSHFETRPGAMYLTLLDQTADGMLTPVATRPIDFSAVEGGWVHCAGSVTPWGTHMGSEEYEPDAKQWTDGNVDSYNAAMAGYYDANGWAFNHNDPTGTSAKALALMNPYNYGWPVEVKVNANGSTDVTKHYAMGRSANEMSYVMPDNRTVYITDDGTNTLILMFIADAAGNLDAGTLYAAKWNQIEDNLNGGRAALGWVNLGHATSGEIDDHLGKTFTAIFDSNAPTGDTCPSGYTSINAGHGGGNHQCLKLKDIDGQNGVDASDEIIASRLETRRLAAMKGATSEFRKVEGFTYNPERRTAYIALSEINKGMTTQPDKEDKGGPNHIHLTQNDCGAVYAMRIGGRVRDTGGKPIASDYVARTMDGLVAGTKVSGDPKNTCDKNGIANPDNLTYLPRYNSLIIGEDTGSGHQNDAIWNYDLLTGSLTRIQTTPYGSETTSPYWYSNLGGHGYLMSVVQHPYGESDQGLSPGFDAERGYVGYYVFPPLQ